MKQISLTLVVVTLFAGITIVGCPPPEVKKESPTLTFDATSETSAAEALGGHVLSFTPTEDGGTFTIDQEVLSDTLGPLDMTTVEGVETLDVADGYDEFAFGGDETFTLYGEAYASVWVGGNGTLAFGEAAPAADATHEDTVGISALRAEIEGGVVTAAVDSGSFIVDWAGVTTVVPADDATKQDAGTSNVQVQGALDSNDAAGVIDIFYEVVDPSLETVTVGVSSGVAGNIVDATDETLSAETETEGETEGATE